MPFPQADVRLEAGGKLAVQRAALDEELRVRISIAEKGDTARTQQQLRCLLDSPLLKAPQRASLLGKYRENAQKLHDAADELDQEDNRQRRLVKFPAVVKGTERNAASLRAGMALALMRVTGADVKSKTTCPPGSAALTPRDTDVLEKRLNEMWGRQFLERWRGAEPNAAGDAVDRLVSPWELEEIVGAADRDCSCVWHEKLRESYLDWLKGCWQSAGRFWDTAPADGDARDYYRDAARSLP